MQDNKDITPYNKIGKPHGYWEVYCNDTIWYKCFFVNGVVYGYNIIKSSGEIKHSYYAR